MIDTAMLTAAEVEWLNAYHKQARGGDTSSTTPPRPCHPGSGLNYRWVRLTRSLLRYRPPVALICCFLLVLSAQVWDTVSPRVSGKALEWLRANTKPLGGGAAHGGNGSGAKASGSGEVAKGGKKEGEKAKAGAA